MTSVSLTFDSISRLVEVIKALKPLGQRIEYGKLVLNVRQVDDQHKLNLAVDDRKRQLKEILNLLLDEKNTKLVKYVLEDMYNDDEGNISEMANEYIKEFPDSHPENLFPTISKNVKLLFSMLVSKHIELDLIDSSALFTYYRNNPLPEIIDLIILNLWVFNRDEIPNFIFKQIVQRMDRRDFYAKVKEMNDGTQDEWQESEQNEWMKAYDKAAKQRAVEVSLGLGYAQFDNQVQSTIPSLVLQQIVNESVDLSGMPAQDVYKLVKHINEGTTNKTIRLGQPSNFEDAKE